MMLLDRFEIPIVLRTSFPEFGVVYRSGGELDRS